MYNPFRYIFNIAKGVGIVNNENLFQLIQCLEPVHVVKINNVFLYHLKNSFVNAMGSIERPTVTSKLSNVSPVWFL